MARTSHGSQRCSVVLCVYNFDTVEPPPSHQPRVAVRLYLPAVPLSHSCLSFIRDSFCHKVITFVVHTHTHSFSVQFTHATQAGGKPIDELEHGAGTGPAKDPVPELRASPGALPGGERRAGSRARPTRAPQSSDLKRLAAPTTPITVVSRGSTGGRAQREQQAGRGRWLVRARGRRAR